MAKRWPPVVGVVGFDGGHKPTISLALRPLETNAEAQGEPSEQIGACCYDDGTCEEVSEFDCRTSGGTYQGDGTTCEDVECTGACCEPTCVEDLTPDQCEEDGGEFQGFGTTCDPNPCPGCPDCPGNYTTLTVAWDFSYQDSPTPPIGHAFSGSGSFVLDITDCSATGGDSIFVTVVVHGEFGDETCEPDAEIGASIVIACDPETGEWGFDFQVIMGDSETVCGPSSWPPLSIFCNLSDTTPGSDTFPLVDCFTGATGSLTLTFS